MSDDDFSWSANYASDDYQSYYQSYQSEDISNCVAVGQSEHEPEHEPESDAEPDWFEREPALTHGPSVAPERAVATTSGGAADEPRLLELLIAVGKPVGIILYMIYLWYVTDMDPRIFVVFAGVTIWMFVRGDFHRLKREVTLWRARGLGVSPTGGSNE